MSKDNVRRTILYFRANESYFIGSHITSIVRAFHDFSEKYNYDILIPGELRVPSKSEFHHYDRIHELVRKNRTSIDGVLISPSTMMMAGMSIDDIVKKYIEPYRTNPIVSIEHPIAGTHCVTSDNFNGTKQVTEHLITKHHARRIAYLGLSLPHPNDLIRQNGYRSALKEHGLAFDDELLLPSDISAAVSRIVALKSKRPDAIVCFADGVAFPLMKELRKHGIIPGKDIAVTGFDDDHNFIFKETPLTTARQPFYDLTFTAAEMLNNLIEGRDVPKEISVGCSLVVRESCGCRKSIERKEARSYNITASSWQSAWAKSVLDEIGGLLSSSMMPNEDISETTLQLLLLISKTSSVSMKNDTIAYFENILRQEMSLELETSGNASVTWLGVLTAIEHLLPEDSTHADCSSMRDMVGDMRSICVDEGLRRLSNTSSKERVIVHQLVALNSELMSVFDNDAIRQNMFSQCRILNIDYCALFLYPNEIEVKENGIIPSLPNELTSFFIYSRGGTMDNGTVVDTAEGLIKRVTHTRPVSTYIIKSLYCAQHELGILLLSVQPDHPLDYEGIRSSVSAALYGSRLLKHKSNVEHKLRDALTELEGYNSMLRQLAEKDELTGLLNRHGFISLAERFLAAKRTAKEAFFIIFADLDDLKKINDSFGHNEGDLAIKAAADILRNSFRSQDIIARFGGDEFVVLAELGSNDQSIVDKRLRTAIAACNTESPGKTYTIDLSCGWYQYDPSKDADQPFDILLKKSDALLYAAKSERKRKKH